MKAQSFFGGTSPKQTGEKVRQVGHSGSVQSKTTSLPMHENVKQVTQGGGGLSIQRKTNVKQAYTLGSKGESMNDKGRVSY